jgi:colanic acid biosynthesis glycosyl transferase WcaI
MVDQLARQLASHGHEVTVAAGYPHHPHGKILGGYSRRPLLRERRGEVRVLRGWHFLSEDRRISRRAVVMASQALAIGVAAQGASRPDVIVSYGPPLVGPIVSALAARRFGAGLVTVIYDIYPDVAVENRKVTNPLVIGAARILERLTYRWSDRLLVLSEGFKAQLVRKGIPLETIAVVPVWLDPDEVRPAARDNAWRREQGIPAGTRVVLYAGTIGIVSGAALMLDVAARLADRRDLLFLFVGEGQVKDEIEAAARSRGLSNVRFLPFQPRERLGEVQATSDVSVVTLSRGNGHMSVPSKVIGYLAAGRPVVASVDLDCDTAACVRDAGAGFVVPPGDADGMAAAVETLLDDEGLRVRQGAAARRAFERDYAAEAVMSRYERLLEEVVREKRA